VFSIPTLSFFIWIQQKIWAKSNFQRFIQKHHLWNIIKLNLKQTRENSQTVMQTKINYKESKIVEWYVKTKQWNEIPPEGFD
jgi:hypothetical protein